MIICPECKNTLDFPFEIEECSFCGYVFTKQNTTQTISEQNPFKQVFLRKVMFEKGSLFLDKYIIEEFMTQKGIFSYYRIKHENDYFILQIMSFDIKYNSHLINNFEKQFLKYPYEPEFLISMLQFGIHDNYVYFILEYFSFTTLDDILKSTDSLSIDFSINLFLFLIDFYNKQKNKDSHLFLIPQNIVNLGNNQFKILNYKTQRFFANMAEPSFYFNKEVLPYLSPELINDDLIINHKCDLYSIGKIFKRIINMNIFLGDENKNIDLFKETVSEFVEKMILNSSSERDIDIISVKTKLNNFLSTSVLLKKEEHEEIIELEDLKEEELFIEEQDVEIEPETEIEIEININNPPEIKITSEEKPPVLNTIPPEIKINLISEDDFKKARTALLKDPFNAPLLKIVYSYYVSKNLLDEAYIVSTILNFLNDLSESEFIFKQYKNFIWEPKDNIIDDNVWFKIIPKQLYFNTSGMMIHLKKFLDLSKNTISPINPKSNNFENIDTTSEKYAIIKSILSIYKNESLKIKLTDSDIGGNDKTFSQIYKQDESITLVFKKSIFNSLESKVFKVIISKFIALTYNDVVGNFIYEVPVIQDMFNGLLKYLVPSARALHNNKISNLVYKGVQDALKENKLIHEDIVKLVILINEHIYNRKQAPDIAESMKYIEITSDRFALIISNDLNSTLKMFRNYENLNVSLNAKERVKELLKFVLSDNYFQIRKIVGQSIIK